MKIPDNTSVIRFVTNYGLVVVVAVAIIIPAYFIVKGLIGKVSEAVVASKPACVYEELVVGDSLKVEGKDVKISDIHYYDSLGRGTLEVYEPGKKAY